MNSIVPSEGVLVLDQIDSLLPQLLMAEVSIVKARTQIGILLNEVREKQYWKIKGYDSFGDYIEFISATFNRQRTQLYAFAMVARDLIPIVGAEKLTEMGLEKAKLLCQAKRAGSIPEPKIIDMAADDTVTTKQFRQALVADKKIPDTPSGRYYEIEYFATPERQNTIQDAFVSVKRTELGASETVAEEIRMGEVLEILAQEYLGAHTL